MFGNTVYKLFQKKKYLYNFLNYLNFPWNFLKFLKFWRESFPPLEFHFQRPLEIKRD